MALYSRPRAVHQLIARQRFTRVANQRLQDRELAAGQRHRFVFAEHLAGAEVQFEFAERDHRLFLRRRARQFVSPAAQHRTDASQQLTRVERLRNVVVGADFQPHDAIDLFAFGGDHNDRHRVALAAQAAADGQPIFAR